MIKKESDIMFQFNSVSESDLSKCVPIFSHNGTNIVKTNGNFKIDSSKLLRPIKINETVEHILNNSNGKNTIKDILDSFSTEFEELPPYEILKQETLNTLYSLWNLSVLKWKNMIYPYDSILNLLRSTSEGEILYSADVPLIINQRIQKFKDRSFIDPNHNIESFYSKQTFLQRYNYNMEHFFSLSVNDNVLIEISLLPSFVLRPVLDITYFNIGYYYCNKFALNSVDKKEYLNFLSWACNWYLKNMGYLEFESNIFIYLKILEENQNVERELFSIFNPQKVGLLEKEINSKNVSVYEIYVNKMDSIN